jgi:hypothetical protein
MSMPRPSSWLKNGIGLNMGVREPGGIIESSSEPRSEDPDVDAVDNEDIDVERYSDEEGMLL